MREPRAVDDAMRVIVTRPAAQAVEWVARLVAAGFEAVALPLVGIEALADDRPVRAAWADLARRRLVAFVSPNAVIAFFGACPPGAAWPAGTLAGSPGPGTTRALRHAGVPAERIVEPPADAASFDADTLWAVVAGHDWRGADALIVRGDTGRDRLRTLLVAAGARVEVLPAYRRGETVLAPDQLALLRAGVADPRRHVWFFSHSAAIERLVAMPELADAGRPGPWAEARAIATHPRIAETARALGFGRVALASPAPEAVVACLQSHRL